MDANKEKMRFAFKQFLIGLGVFGALIVWFSSFPMSFGDSPDDAMNGMDFARIVFIPFGFYGWWAYCKKSAGLK